LNNRSVADGGTSGVGNDNRVGTGSCGTQARDGVAGAVGARDGQCAEFPLVLEAGTGCGNGQCDVGAGGLCDGCNRLGRDHRGHDGTA